MIRFRKIVFILIPLLNFVFLSNGQDISITIAHVTDIHGNILPYNYIYDREMDYSLAHLSTFLNEYPANNEEIILLDGGDNLQGQPLVYYSNFMDTANLHVNSKASNILNFDASVIGNHDIEAGPTVYNKLKEEYEFPLLGANVIHMESGKPYFQPYCIIEKQGVRIAVLGLTTPGIPGWLPEVLYPGLEFDDMVTTAEKWMKIIKENENPDIVVGLFHSGIDYTYGNVDRNTFKNENASLLIAEKVAGFDVILAGHDHRIFNETVKESGYETIVLDPGSHARNVAIAKIKLKKENGDYKITQKTGEIIQLSDYEPDNLFVDELKDYHNKTKSFISRKIGKIGKTIHSKDALFGPAAFTDLIHKVQLDITDADVSFTAPLAFNTTLENGDILVSDMFKLYRYENFLYTIKMTGKEIDGFLEYSYDGWFDQVDGESKHLLLFKKDKNNNPQYDERRGMYVLKNNYYNFDSAAGITYTVDITKPAGNRILISSLSDGRVFYEDSVYYVAINSYRANGGGGHMEYGAGSSKEEVKNRMICSTQKDLRFYLIEWFKKSDNITFEKISDWEVIPEDLYIKLMNNDQKILFKEDTNK